MRIDYIKRLGSGHFGEVWHINDLYLNTEYALKMIPPNKVINKDNFYQEAQTLKAAQHPNIVQVFDTGKMTDGKIYVKMEYLERGSLEDEASGAYVVLTRAKKVMVDVLRGLQFAHEKNIVHRDIKPANILIGNSGEGKLSDFGLALPNFKKINFAAIKNYQYFLHLAPEVDKLSDYDVKSDIYACGMTLYRLVNGDTYIPTTMLPTELRKQIKTGKFPDRSHYREFVPLSLKKIINKALSVNPTARYSSAEDFRHGLEQVKLYVDWDEKLLGNGIQWQATIAGTAVQLTRYKNKLGSWNVDFKRGKNLGQLRKVNRLCVENATIQQAVKFSGEVLQSFVTGKEK